MAALALLSLGALAQGRHEFNLMLGGYKSEFIEMEPNADIVRGDLFDIYETHYHVDSGPCFTLDYKFALNSVIKVGAQFNWGEVDGYTWYRMGTRKGEEFRMDMLSLLPQVKFCIIPNSRHFRPYAKLAAGVQYTMNTKGAVSTAPVKFAWEVVPIGAEWGGQVIYGTAEFCYGTIVKGARIGIGYRF